MFGQLKFVWARLVCVFREHSFDRDGNGIVYCTRCNWYGGPSVVRAGESK